MKKRMKILVPVVVLLIAGVAVKLIWFSESFRYAGTLEATKVDISSQLASKIKSVMVREGNHVQEQQTLITLSCEDIRVASNLANENYNRNLRLYKSGTAS